LVEGTNLWFKILSRPLFLFPEPDRNELHSKWNSKFKNVQHSPYAFMA
jgi:hypothetical protein